MGGLLENKEMRPTPDLPKGGGMDGGVLENKK
jgi:hypothetical protein